MNVTKISAFIIIVITVTAVIYYTNGRGYRENHGSGGGISSSQTNSGARVVGSEVNRELEKKSIQNASRAGVDKSQGAISNGRNPKRQPANLRSKPRELKHPLSKYLNSKFGGKWKENLSEDGRLEAVMGGSIEDYGDTPERGYELIKEIAPFLGVDEREVHIYDGQHPEGTRIKTLSYVQKINGLLVYGGYFAFRVNKKNNSIYLINNGLKKVEIEDTSVSIGSEKAKTIIVNHFGSSQISLLELAKNDPIIWAESPPHETAWEFIVHLKGNKIDIRQVIIGAHSGKILKNISKLIR